MKKQILSAMVAVAYLCVSDPTVGKCADAKPMIVRTETWTASYYLNDDDTVLYPYADCTADIYSDGVVRVSAINTFDWEALDIYPMKCILPYATTTASSLESYNEIVRGEVFTQDGLKFVPLRWDENSKSLIPDYTVLDGIDMNYYPSGYSFYLSSARGRSPNLLYGTIGADMNYHSWGNCYIAAGYPVYRGEENNLDAATPKGAVLCTYIFSPYKEITSDVTIRVFGHDILISSETLESTSTDTMVYSYLDDRITELEEEVNRLTVENIELQKHLQNGGDDSILRLDANGDGAVNAVDASIVLGIYAYNSTNGNHVDTVSAYLQTLK